MRSPGRLEATGASRSGARNGRVAVELAQRAIRPMVGAWGLAHVAGEGARR